MIGGRPEPRRGSSIRDFARITCIATLLALYVRTFVVMPLHVPTESMAPALLPGDHVLVDRLAAVSGFGLLPGDTPRRGDVLVLKAPGQRAELVVKRCVALGGERVEQRQGRLLVDGQPIQAPWARRTGPDFSAVDVDPGHVFVLGDHSTRSIDSRRWGPVDVRSCVGRAVVVYWSTAARDRAAWDTLAESLATKLTTTRWDRILRPVR